MAIKDLIPHKSRTVLVGGGDLMTYNPKLEKYLFLGSSGCIFGGGRGGPGESSCHEGSEYVCQRGVGIQKCLFMGGF